MTTNARDEKWSEWIDWSGGECPLPDGTLCDVKYRSGEVNRGVEANILSDIGSMPSFGAIDWGHTDSSYDIIAYRYKIKEPESVEVTEAEEEAWQAKEREMSIDEARAILSNDNVNHPQHYQSDNGIECIDAIRAALGVGGFVAHCRGTAIKYAFRAGKKQAHAEDLRKAAWYLTRAAEAMEE